jgi:HEAT repeat protein/uncharacterized protein YfkK (UPF0435 family)
MFINRIGIEQLPLLFIVNAILVITGTVIFSRFVEKIRKEILIIINILLAVILLISATLFVIYSSWIFFGLILIAQSVIISQLNIVISLVVEELFTPLESQRTFPIIESSETIGAIIGGIIVSTLAYSIPSYKFFYIWVLCLMLVIPIILSFRSLSTDIPTFEHRKDDNEGGWKKIAGSFKKAQKSSFLKGLIIVIILQWMVINLVEFQYMKSVEQSITETPEETLAYENLEGTFEANILISTDEPIKESTEEEIIKTTTKNEEEALMEKLGMLQIIFGIATLAMQLFLSSRIIKGLGIIKSMAIHPLVTLANMVNMILKFNIVTASTTKAFSEMSGILFLNAYHSSYYAFEENIRGQMKELLEGVIKPSGAVLGMGLIILLENFAKGTKLTFTINIILIIIAILSAALISSLQTKYTEQSRKNIDKSGNDHTRINAIEILAQRGHKIDHQQLIKIILRENEPEEIRLKAVETLKQRKDPETLPDLLTCIKSTNPNVRLAIIETLGEFKNLHKHFFKSGFGHYRIQETLKGIFEREEHEEIRSAIIKVLAQLNQRDLIPFILKNLNSPEEKIVADCIYICGLFKDPNSIYYLEQYLDNPSSKIRANAIIALWQFKILRSKLNHYLEQLIQSTEKEKRLMGMYIIGELKLKEKKTELFKLLKEDGIDAVLALAKLSEPSALTRLLDHIINNKKDWKKIRKQINRLPKRFVERLKQYLHQEVSHKIHKILVAHSHLKPEEFDRETLEELMYLYDLIQESKAKSQIENILNKKCLNKI